MKIFSLVGLALAANSMLVNGYTLKQQQQQVINPATRPDFLAPPEAPVPEPPAIGLAGSAEGALAASIPVQGEPYAFAYDHSSDQFSNSRSELSDGKKVTGHYTLQGADGVQRIVHYVADGDGFRASIQTNEPGTESQNPSGVLIQSSQLPGAEIARQFGPGEPQPVIQPNAAPFAPVSSQQQFGSVSPAFVAFQGQQQQQEEDDEEPKLQQQQQQQEEEEVPAPAPVKSRPSAPAVPALPPPPPTTTTQSPPVKGRPVLSKPKVIAQQAIKSLPPPTKSIQQPIKSAPIVKSKPIAQLPAPVKGKPAPAPTQAPPVKGRPNTKIPSAPTKTKQQVIAPKPLPALLPIPAPQPIKTPNFQPQQQQQQEEEPEPAQQQQEPAQQQQSEIAFEEPQEEPAQDQDF